jgi:hypothetical protein
MSPEETPAGYVVRLVLMPRVTAVTRLVLAAVASTAGVGVPAVAVSQWGRSWLAVAVALAAALRAQPVLRRTSPFNTLMNGMVLGEAAAHAGQRS